MTLPNDALTFIFQTVSVMYAYFLALAIHPKVEANAHAEMDCVVGQDRLPTFEDRDQLPYVDAICKEVIPLP
jgi:hypothetical protein